jgi:predicted nucleic acid-binding protein
MNVVLDTNVVVSAVLTAHGPCARIIDLLGAGAYALCADDRILGEYDSVLRRPELGIASADVELVMGLVRHVVLPIAAVPLSAALPDPDDLPFLEVAAVAGAVLVTGNTRHFPEGACGGVRVVSPAEFLLVLRRLA